MFIKMDEFSGGKWTVYNPLCKIKANPSGILRDKVNGS